MADIINLKDVRKARARADAETKAAENRVRYGRTREERNRQALEDRRARRELDGSKIEPADKAKKPAGRAPEPDTETDGDKRR